MKILSVFKNLDWWLISACFSLSAIGLLSIYSTSFYQNGFSQFYKQLIFLGLAFIALVLFSLWDYRVLRSHGHSILFIYLFLILSLLGLFFMPKIRGIQGWYKLGPVSFDPVPFMGLGLIIVLAKYLSSRYIHLRQFHYIVFSSLYALVPAFLVFLQPDLGSALILVLIWLGMILVSGIKFSHLSILFLIALFVLGGIWTLGTKEYQRERITDFLSSSFSDNISSWHLRQAEIAIGSGGILGKGFLQGSQARYGFLPEAKTDFIFSAIAEEFGLIGIFALLSLFLFIVWRIGKIIFSSMNNFARLFGVGLGILLTAQVFVNIGMNLGLLPIIGIPLPLVSYGGSGLIAFYIGMGLIMSIKRHD
jgi:rod shape determining protein RodA